MKALVLGASGFIGGALVRALRTDGHDVVAFGRPDADLSAAEALGASVARGSILDPNAIASAAAGQDVVFHAAGTTQQGAPEAVYRWLFVAGTENVVAASKSAGVERLVFLSCSDVTLTDADRVHWDEKRDLVGEPIGARAKCIRLAEEIALASGDGELAVTVVRPGWVWGPGDRTRLPALIREAKNGGLRLCGSGKNLVSTSHVDLVAKIALAAARSPNAPGHVYHATDGELLELRELFAALTKALGLPAPIAGPPGPIAAAMTAVGKGLPREELVFRRRSTLFDASLALGELGVEPTLSIEAGMKALARWVETEGGLDAVVANERKPPQLDALTLEARAAEAAAEDG